MLNAFLKFIQHHKLIARNEKVLLAVSGGIDSVVLTDLTVKSGFRFAIAHCNFQLRGGESDGDEKFVQELATRLGVECYVKKFDTSKVASAKGISTQMAARELRYQWFEEIMTEKGYDKLANAHHKNDILETVIFNITKGTGIAGLHGIKAKSGQIIRPLLFATRQEIATYAKHENLSWREDSSNVSLKYSRNLIRRKIIPVMKEINPNLENTMEQTILRVSAVESFFLANLEKIKRELIEVRDDDIWLSIEKLDKIAGKEAVLDDILKSYGFNFPQVTDILNALEDRQPGKLFHSPNYTLNIDRTHLILSERGDTDREMEISRQTKTIYTANFILQVEKKVIDDYRLIKSREIAFLDFDKLSFPLKLRKWEEGDRFQPIGMKGQKKVSDFMIDEKIPVNLKNKVFVLTSGSNIVWVVGRRIDDRYKITESTKNILKITKEGHHV